MTREEFEYSIKSCGFLIHQGQTYYEESELIKVFEDMGLIEQEPTDRIEYGTDGNAYKLWISNGKEYEPSDDLISRQAVYHILDEVGGDFDKPREAVVPVDYIADMVGELPPVTPQSKTGHWIADVDRWGDVVTTVNGYRCDQCNAFNTDKDNYCPNCGAKMVEPQERSDKE